MINIPANPTFGHLIHYLSYFMKCATLCVRIIFFKVRIADRCIFFLVVGEFAMTDWGMGKLLFFLKMNYARVIVQIVYISIKCINSG